MPSNSIHAVEGLRHRVRTISDAAIRLSTLRNRLLEERQSKKEEIRELTVRIELLSQVGELFRLLLDQMVVRQVRVVEDLVTEGLQTIFHGLDLSFESEVSQKYGKVSIDFFVRRGRKEDPLSHRGRPLESFGGGPSSVASLILRVLSVLKLRRYPLLVLDESLGAVSDEYVTATAQFIKGLAHKMGIDVLLVTHKQGFLEYSDQAYRCNESLGQSGPCLALKDVK